MLHQLRICIGHIHRKIHIVIRILKTIGKLQRVIASRFSATSPHHIIPIKPHPLPTLKPIPITQPLLLHTIHRRPHPPHKVPQRLNQITHLKPHPTFLAIPHPKIKPLTVPVRVYIVVQDEVVGLAEGAPIGEKQVAGLEVAAEFEVAAEGGVPVGEGTVVLGGVVEVVVEVAVD